MWAAILERKIQRKVKKNSKENFGKKLRISTNNWQIVKLFYLGSNKLVFRCWDTSNLGPVSNCDGLFNGDGQSRDLFRSQIPVTTGGFQLPVCCIQSSYLTHKTFPCSLQFAIQINLEQQIIADFRRFLQISDICFQSWDIDFFERQFWLISVCFEQEISKIFVMKQLWNGSILVQ